MKRTTLSNVRNEQAGGLVTVDGRSRAADACRMTQLLTSGGAGARTLILLGLAAIGIALASCGSDSRAAVPTVLDSAGVSIVTTGHIDTTAVSQWRLRTEPAVRIGVVEGDSVYQLFNARSAYRRPDGSLVVANSGSREIRFYDGTGRHLRSVGRRGQGPGEYGYLRWARPYRGDSMVSLDGTTTRITVSDAQGRYARSFTPEAPGERPIAYVVGIFPDGSFLAQYGERAATSQDSTRVERPAISYGLWTPDGAFVREVRAFSGEDQFIRADGRSVSVAPLPFGRQTTVAVFGDHVLVAENSAPEISLFDQDGRLVRIVRAPWARPPLSDRDAQAHRQEQLASIEPTPFADLQRASIRATPYPELLPFYGEVVVDADRNIWVQGPPTPGRNTDRWLVFSEAGTYAGWIAIPRSLRVTQIDSDAIVGIATDDLGVQYVEVYPIERLP